MAGNARSLGSVSSTNGNRWTHLKEGRGNVTQKMPLQSECHRAPQASEQPVAGDATVTATRNDESLHSEFRVREHRSSTHH